MYASVSVSHRDHDSIIGINGRFDFNIRAKFKSVVNDAINKHRPAKIILDLHMTDYIDSSGMGMLLLFRENVGASVNIDIINCNPHVKSILKISNFQKIFNIT